MKISYQNDDRNIIEIMTTSNGLRLWATNGQQWREWNTQISEIPHIYEFITKFGILADEMIGRIGNG